MDTQSRPNEIEVARRRMRHLARLNIEPVPMLHIGKRLTASTEPGAEARQRNERLAFQVLAVQMSHTFAASALG